jgi:sec-independent protein translocase protein TatC
MSKVSDTATGARMLGSRMIQMNRQKNPEGRMPLGDHIRELRSRMVKAALAIGLAMIVGVIWFHPIWNFIQHPYCAADIHGVTGCHGIGHELVVTNILDPFNLRVEVAFIVGLIIASPVWLYQLWAFISPGLYSRERKWTYLFVAIAAPLFLIGAGLAYLAMSRGLGYLLGLTPTGIISLPNIDTYFSYMTWMLVGFGLAFELPLLLVMLNLAGVLHHSWFRRWRRMMIFVVFVFAGIASPSPDPVTMLLLAVPCLVLCEVAELLIWSRDRRRDRTSPYADLGDDETSPLEPTDHTDLNVDATADQ